MRWILIAVVLGASVSVFAVEPATPEVDRLRRENADLRRQVADLKAQVAKLTAELATLKPPTPKATKYTAEQIVKLLPADRSKSQKVLEANLLGEWVRMEARIRIATDDPKGNTSLQASQPTSVDPNFFTDFRFESKLPHAEKYVGQVVAVVGKVKGVIVNGDSGVPHFIIQLSECQLVK